MESNHQWYYEDLKQDRDIFFAFTWICAGFCWILLDDVGRQRRKPVGRRCCVYLCWSHLKDSEVWTGASTPGKLPAESQSAETSGRQSFAVHNVEAYDMLSIMVFFLAGSFVHGKCIHMQN